jgi:hypothetical protein
VREIQSESERVIERERQSDREINPNFIFDFTCNHLETFLTSLTCK